MELFWLISGFVLLFVYLFDRKVLRFSSEQYFCFFKIMLIGSALSIVLHLSFGSYPPLPLVSFGTLLLVGWEDVLFSLLPIYYGRKILHPRISTILTFIAAISFGLGHIYQGGFWTLITCFYPFYVSYHIGKRHGYGTTIALHVTYDIIVVSTVYIINTIGSIL